MKASLLALFCAIPFLVPAQVEYLRLSPSQKIVQRVGATDVEIDFSRPQMKGRQIFGHLVPFGQLWRTGANENTTIAFDHRVRIGETEVPAGKYALLTKPMADSWEIYFYSDTDNLDVPNPLDSAKLRYLTTGEVTPLKVVEETLTINIYDITETAANLGIAWETSSVRIPISFYTQEAMDEMIQQELTQNLMDYAITATYYYERDIELEKARELQELLMELRGSASAWDLYRYGIIMMKLGDKEAATQHFTSSLAMARDDENEYLIAENERLLEEVRRR
ncbi:MAG: DUF2911 domain-containing protein [Bacteroidota bacterium]